jgi:uncharacterized membrane protein
MTPSRSRGCPGLISPGSVTCGTRHRPRPLEGRCSGALGDLILLGPEDGEGVATVAPRLRGVGIDETFLREVKAQLQPETSALLVLSGDADLDQVRPVIERGLARGDVILMHAQLAPDGPDMLRAAVRDLQNSC